MSVDQAFDVSEVLSDAQKDIPSEMAVLGAVMLSPEALAEVTGMLASDDFYRPAHQRVWEVIAARQALSQPIDVTLVYGDLADSGDLSRAGGPAYLHTIVSSVPTTANASFYAQRVRETSTRRKLAGVATRLSQLAAGGEGVGTDVNSLDIADTATALIAQAVSGVTSHSSGVRLIGEEGDAFLHALENPAYDRLPTGYVDLDEIFGGGLSGGQLVIVAGRPAMGKSIVGTDIARRNAMAGRTALLFSLEMSRPEIYLRLISAETGIPQRALGSGALTDDQWGTLVDRIGHLAGAPLYVDDRASITLAEVRATAMHLHRTVGLDLVVVDYMQLMNGTSANRGGFSSRQEDISEISRGLKILAKDLDIPVVALSQLNRGSEQRADKRPQMSDLRESGAIEQDADMIVLIYREEVYFPEKLELAGQTEFIVAKNRNGRTGTVTTIAELDRARIRTVDKGGVWGDLVPRSPLPDGPTGDDPWA